ncbi:MAG: tetratricopeptide repeat protein [Xanthobacteraceae bacterium]|nr:MAG: tetratricopeptide repeat protein [Xanthobacteraceae bacterium]
MQIADARTVLGNFDDAAFDHHGLTSRFFRRDGKFLVETDGRDGTPQTFGIKYVFGVYPLQQYLIEFPDGRLQALSIAWDSRARELGGQRWFHLYPDEKITAADPLHWTGLQQNWNFMCAECHSTDLRKNYDAATDRFSTTWSDLNVGCEACHGPGSRHVAWASDRKRFWPFWRADDPQKGLAARFNDRVGVSWSIDPASGNARRSKPPATGRVEVEVCGRCHARRGALTDAWTPGKSLSDTHAVALLEQWLFEADGQMREEVYNYQSFRQSRMYAAGVTCSDCHDPHSQKLRAEGSAVCGQCHDAGKYQAPAHHFHEREGSTVTCISCHMPARTYMAVDTRHDHGFRIPRPDLSVRLGTPNTCNGCHRDKSFGWAAEAVEKHHGPVRKTARGFAEAFHAARTHQPDAAARLERLARNPDEPAIARATALVELGPSLSPGAINVYRGGLADPDPLVRIGALRGLAALAAGQRWNLASALLDDKVRGVRIEAAAFLAPVPPSQLSADDRRRFDRAADDYVAAQRFNADRPEARSNLGNFYAQRGRPAEAEREYLAALRLDPRFAAAAIGLADVYRLQRRDREGEAVLRQSASFAPQDAAIYHALGLALVRLKKSEAAMETLKTAADLDPAQPHYAYVYAIALNSGSRSAEALRVLEANLARHPQHAETLSALVSINRENGRGADTLRYAEKLYALNPAVPGLRTLIDRLRRSPGASP